MPACLASASCSRIHGCEFLKASQSIGTKRQKSFSVLNNLKYRIKRTPRHVKLSSELGTGKNCLEWLKCDVLWRLRHSTPPSSTARGKTGEIAERRMSQSRSLVYLMVPRRAAGAGIKTLIGCHTFRATGITEYQRFELI
jgi:hypothetical protein